MELLNLKVKHKAFGTGIVMQVSDNYLTIKFATKQSKFIYPDSFEKFIVAEDASIQAAIMLEVKAKQVAEAQRQAAEAARKAEVARKAEDELSAPKRQVASATRKRKHIEDGFGPDYHVNYLAKQPVLTYQQVEAQFGIKIAGFGRGINRTEAAVILISSVDKKKTGFVYHDHWTAEGDYLYSGEGKTGDQTITLGNKAIMEAARDGKQIHLFVKFSPKEYYYQGVFFLVDYTYEDDKDESGNVRKEYKFRLRKQTVEE